MAFRPVFCTVTTLVMALTVVAYLPGFHGPLLLDDFHNLPGRDSFRGGWQSWWEITVSGHAGPLRRPLAQLSFMLNAVTGGGIVGYRIVNLIIHLLNGMLIYRVGTLLLAVLKRPHPGTTAALAAGLWLLHPLNVSTVLYVVQRMTGLSALLVLTGMLAYLHGRIRMTTSRTGAWPLILSSFTVFPALAALSKENGILLLVLLFLVEGLVLRQQGLTFRQRRLLSAFFFLFLALPLLTLCTLLWLQPELLLGGYRLREFTLDERLLTEARALWFYLGLILFPHPGPMSLFHDDFTLSSSLFSPPSTLPALLGLFALVTLCWKWRRSHPLFALAGFWFFAGHSVESGFLPLEPVFEHRNYLPMAGLMWLTADILTARIPRHVLPTAAAVLLLVLATATGYRSWLWGNRARMVTHDLSWHPRSLRLQNQLADLHWRQYRSTGERTHRKAAVTLWEKLSHQDPASVHELAALLTVHHPDEHPRYRRWRNTFLERLATGISPEDMKVIQRLVLCRPRCPVDPALAPVTLDTALTSRDLDTGNRAALCNLKAIHLYRQGDTDGAGQAMRCAVTAAPENPLYRIGLARWRRLNGDCRGARQELVAARQADWLRRWGSEIERELRLCAKGESDGPP